MLLYRYMRVRMLSGSGWFEDTQYEDTYPLTAIPIFYAELEAQMKAAEAA